ncbi:MAG: hypothetical protein ACXW13_00445 [Burkholderiaceae bacterium]
MKGDFFYALLVFAAFVVLPFSFLADLVEYASNFSNAEAAAEAFHDDASWKDRKIVVAAGEKK